MMLLSSPQTSPPSQKQELCFNVLKIDHKIMQRWKAQDQQLEMEHLSAPTLMLVSFLSYIQQRQAKVYS